MRPLAAKAHGEGAVNQRAVPPRAATRRHAPEANAKVSISVQTRPNGDAASSRADAGVTAGLEMAAAAHFFGIVVDGSPVPGHGQRVAFRPERGV